ncbi:hypothetical protein B9479_005505 [Cryptococcus floricola]|uniref:NodB homology domain-containing protein n=1 Tax=Cryptococcus floricola TaxID=2591691 RepID=A0A5D3AUN8_9TREE|nr:hypothetical protein B9479_005505 [Cryptococcus floricola]
MYVSPSSSSLPLFPPPTSHRWGHMAKNQADILVQGDNYGCIYDRADDIKALYDAGHTIGSHTWSHADLNKLSESKINEELEKIETAFVRILGVKPLYFRPPYGNLNDKAKKVLGERGYKKIFMWSDDTEDANGASSGSSKKVLDGIAKDYPNPHLVLSHSPIKTTSQKVLPHSVPKLKAAGYSLVTVGQCLGTDESPYKKVGSPQKKDSSWNPKVPSVQEEHEQQDGTDASPPSKPGIVERASDILREAFGKPKKAEITPFTTEHVEHAPAPPLSECTTSTAPADQDISEHRSSSIPPNISSPPTAIDIPSPAGNLSEIIHHGAPLTGRPQSKKKASLGGEEGSTVVDRAVGVGLEGVEDTPMGERSDPFSAVPLGELGLGAKPTLVAGVGDMPVCQLPLLSPAKPSSEHGEIESDGSDSEEESGQLARGVRESAPEPVDPQSEGNTNTHFSSQPRILPAFDTKPYVPPTSPHPSQPPNQTSPSLSPKTSPKQETVTLPIYPLPASPSRSISAPNVSSPSSPPSSALPLPISSRGAPGQRDVPRVFPSMGSVVAEPAWSREGSPELGSELEVIPASPPPPSSSHPQGLSLEEDGEEEYHPGEKREHEPRLCEPRSEGPESLAFGSLRVHSPGSTVSPLSPVSPDITTPPSVYDSASASASSASGGGTGVHSGSGSGSGSGAGTGTGMGEGTGKGKAPPLPSTLVGTLQQQAEEQEEAAGLKKLTPIHPEE